MGPEIQLIIWLSFQRSEWSIFSIMVIKMVSYGQLMKRSQSLNEVQGEFWEIQFDFSDTERYSADAIRPTVKYLKDFFTNLKKNDFNSSTRSKYQCKSYSRLRLISILFCLTSCCRLSAAADGQFFYEGTLMWNHGLKTLICLQECWKYHQTKSNLINHTNGGQWHQLEKVSMT